MLHAEHVFKTFGRSRRQQGVRAVNDASIRVAPGDFIAIVGESGSGKSTLARILLGLIEPDAGSVTFNGTALSSLNKSEMRGFRTAVQCVLQDPSGSLNPRKTVRQSLTEVIRLHKIAVTSADVEAAAIEALFHVNLTPEPMFLDRYPHELSGGQRQRVLIARAIVLRPQIIIADEAVSALDASVKAGVLNLMNQLRREMGIGYALITHDLPVVKKVASYVYVMKSGAIVEEGTKEQIFANPQADYTKTLLAAAPDLDMALAGASATS
ncbi:hypothetical protein GCM10022381_28960 [Leifsonia kafniensis]|uniref:ABC transporter domain-containing protein n=1 Tax=Leifsonia kafniensis TaxID=475957 RepID=A0ABP7KQL7_9MICO